MMLLLRFYFHIIFALPLDVISSITAIEENTT